jgi:excisionase family DNA binding protein
MEQARLNLDAAMAPVSTSTANGRGDTRPPLARPLTRDDVLTAREVGALLHLPGSSVYYLARRGAIPGHRVGRAWRFVRQEIEDWLLSS